MTKKVAAQIPGAGGMVVIETILREVQGCKKQVERERSWENSSKPSRPRNWWQDHCKDQVAALKQRRTSSGACAPPACSVFPKSNREVTELGQSRAQAPSSEGRGSYEEPRGGLCGCGFRCTAAMTGGWK